LIVAIAELLAVPDRTLEWLKDALQAAVELEFFTIPPYLTAMWSLVKQDDWPAAIFRSVVYEEMEHMALACNMLAGVGGVPRINRGSAVPVYPRPIPGGVKPALTVGLAGLSPETVRTFMAVEAPEKPIQFEVELEAIGAAGEAYPRIGEFYKAVWEAFDQVRPQIHVERQVTGPLAPMVVATLADVQVAIERIQVQGEGTEVDPTAKTVPAARPADLAHYYRFQQLDKRRRLNYHDDKKVFKWSKEQFDFPAAYPVAPVPAGGYRYDEVVPAVAADLRRFDEAYTRLLDHLQAAWDGGGQTALLRAIEWMFALERPARALMTRPIPGTNGKWHYGPNFRYRGPA
jgi:hypothetical protein